MSAPNPDREIIPTFAASKEILVPRAAPDRGQGSLRFTFDPTTGALIVSPDLDLKIRKSLTRAARQIAFRLFLRRCRFEVEYLALKMRYARLRLLRYLAGKLSRGML